MKPMPEYIAYFSRAALLMLACMIAFPAHAAEFRKGQKVWSKNYQTPLRAEPKPLAAVVVNVNFAEKLTVRELQGAWIRVKSGEGEGWVFQGNIADEKPALAPSAGWTTVEASQTDTVAAARPLEPAAKGYAQRHGAEDAEADIEWLDAQAALITEQDLVVIMSEEKLGEYRE
jgi:hypothetical protein